MEEILQRLKGYFDPFVETRMEDWRGIAADLEVLEISNKEELKHAGDKEEWMRFILEGLGVKLITKEKKEYCLEVCLTDEFICDFESFIQGTESEIILRSVSKMKVVAIQRERLLRKFQTSSLASQLGRVVYEQQSLKFQEMRKSFAGLKAEEKYLYLMKQHHGILLNTPMQYIANLLEVTPEQFSRIRRKLRRRDKPDSTQ